MSDVVVGLAVTAQTCHCISFANLAQKFSTLPHDFHDVLSRYLQFRALITV